MFERVGKDSLLYGVSALLVRGLQVFLIPLYSRALSASEYGIVETMVVAGALVNLVVAMEIAQGMARYIADEVNMAARRAYATTSVIFATLAYGVFALAVWVFASDLSELFFADEKAVTVVVLASCAIAVNGIFIIIQDLLRWQLRPVAFATASLAYALGSAGVGIWLVAVLDTGVTGVFFGQLAGALLGLLVSLAGAAGLLGYVFDIQRLQIMLRYSLPLVCSGAAVFGSSFIDRIVVRDVLGLEALGVYGVTARFASVVSILTIGLQAALSPIVFRHWREPSTASILGQIFRWYLVAMVAVIGVLSLLSEIIVATFTGPAFHAGSTVLPLLAFGAMFSTLYVFAPGLFLGGHTGKVALLNVAGALINFFAAVLLTPWLGLLGAALAATIAPAFVFVGYLILGRRWFTVQYQGIRVAFSLVLVAALVIAGVFWPTGSTPWDLAALALKLVLWSLCVSLAFLIGTDAADRRSVLHFFGALALKRTM